MHRFSYDLHIHSCLSPCGDEDMTPANIVGMAALKELDIIAVTDHNSCKNCPAVLHWAENYNLIALPGMELCTIEEVHALCLFADLEAAMSFDNYVYSKLIKIQNKESVFGKQVIYNELEEVTGTEPYLLINATEISFSELGVLMREFQGIYIPAHLDKNSNSLLSNLGFVPPDSDFMAAELANLTHQEEIVNRNPYLKQCNLISNSDAHRLGNINEAIHFIECPSRKKEDILRRITSR